MITDTPFMRDPAAELPDGDEATINAMDPREYYRRMMAKNLEFISLSGKRKPPPLPKSLSYLLTCGMDIPQIATHIAEIAGAPPHHIKKMRAALDWRMHQVRTHTRRFGNVN